MLARRKGDNIRLKERQSTWPTETEWIGQGVRAHIQAPCECHKALGSLIATLSVARSVAHISPDSGGRPPQSSLISLLFRKRKALAFSRNLSTLLVIRPPVCLVCTFVLFATIFGRFSALPASSHLPDNLTTID